MGRSSVGNRAAASQSNAGWFTRQSMSLRVSLATLFVTVLVMGVMVAVIVWHSRTNSVATIKREMHTALDGVN